jgi:hypothetical protein
MCSINAAAEKLFGERPVKAGVREVCARNRYVYLSTNWLRAALKDAWSFFTGKNGPLQWVPVLVSWSRIVS